jgi:polyhydroxybutyrate depolymerase
VVTAVVSLAGASYLDWSDCHATAPVHVLQVHGSNDQGLLYDGGCFFDDDTLCYPGALEMMSQWARHNGCSEQADTSLPPLDISDLYPGAETTVRRHRRGCLPGGSAELWTVHGAGHTPMYNDSFGPAVLELLFELTGPGPPPRVPSGRAEP